MSNSFARLTDAVERLKRHFETRTQARLVFGRTWTEDELREQERKYGIALPPSYRFFVMTYGTLAIEHRDRERFPMVTPDMLFGVSPDVEDAAGADDPDEPDASAVIEDAIAHALFFQYQSTDAVQDFFVFSKRYRREDGELHVMSYRHDEVFENPAPPPNADHSGLNTFEDHLCEFVDHVTERLNFD